MAHISGGLRCLLAVHENFKTDVSVHKEYPLYPESHLDSDESGLRTAFALAEVYAVRVLVLFRFS